MKASDRLKEVLFADTPIGPLVWFRIAYGAALFFHFWYFLTGTLIDQCYVDPQYLFHFDGFAWVPRPSREVIHNVYFTMAILSLMVMAGLLYRLAAIGLFVLYTYVYLLTATLYNNHYYLMVLLSMLTVILPMNRALALDLVRNRSRAVSHVPAWTVYLLRFQIALPYVYGGIAKLNPDWMTGKPMDIWLLNHTWIPVFGPYVSESWVAYFFSYSGIVIDLILVPMLLIPNKWLRIFIAVTLASFHLMNMQLFHIGIFPWLMLLLIPVLLPTSWIPMAWLQKLAEKKAHKPEEQESASAPAVSVRRQKVVVLFFTGYLLFHLLFPFRHYFYPGDASWTDEGHRFSWRMMLRDKKVDVKIFAKEPATGEKWEVNHYRILSPHQTYRVYQRPYMLHQFCRYLKEYYREQGREDVELYVYANASLNGREKQLMINPQIDLGSQPVHWITPYPWILPLKEQN